MDANQIIIIAIIVLVGIILVFGIYFLIIYMHDRKSNKRMETIFNPTNLVEEESLLNVMDEKKNIEFKKDEDIKDTNTYLHKNTGGNEDTVVTSEAMTQEQKSNPFGVDLTPRNKENPDIPIDIDSNSQNKFFK